jgi:hypothetical protein
MRIPRRDRGRKRHCPDGGSIPRSIFKLGMCESKNGTRFTSGRLRTKLTSTGFLPIRCCPAAMQNNKPLPQKNDQRFFLVKRGCKVQKNMSNRGHICRMQNDRVIVCNRMYTRSSMGRSGGQRGIPCAERI